MQDNPNVFAIIDIGLYWSFWHRASQDSEGTDVAVDRFVGMCRTVSTRHRRTVICADSEKLFRRGIPGGEGYKRRPEKPAEAVAGLATSERLIRESGLPVWRAEGYEADDGIAAYATEAAKAGWTVRIYSEDKDLEALIVTGSISIYKRDREKGGLIDWTEEHVRNRRGVPPSRVPELLAIAGDKADSIPGVNGLGEEAAKALIAAYPSVFDAYQDVGEDGLPARVCAERTRKALKTHKEAFDLSWALVKLDMTAVSHIDRKLIEIPEEEHPDDEQPAPGGSAEEPKEDRKSEPSHVETAPNGAQTQVLHETKREEQKPPSLLDQVADHTDQRAKAEGWIGRTFEDALEPRTAKDAYWLAGQLYDAMSPGKGKNAPMVRTYGKIGNRQAIFAVILKGRELRLGAMLSLAHIKPVEGKIEVDAMLMMGLALRSGRVSSFRWIESDNTKATIEITVDGRQIQLTWDLATAKQAGLYPAESEYAPWRRYTRVMLRWRAVSEVLRMNVPEAVQGLYTKGEIGEMDDADIESGLAAEKALS